jgi:prevent-host-death family protein
MKTVGIAELKARLSEYLRIVRRGHPIVVLDRDTPVARIVPYRQERRQRLRVRKPAGRYPSIHDIPRLPPLESDPDIVALLLQERQSDR